MGRVVTKCVDCGEVTRSRVYPVHPAGRAHYSGSVTVHKAHKRRGERMGFAPCVSCGGERETAWRRQVEGRDD